MKAAKGLFITTSSRTRDARDRPEKLTKRIALSEQLAAHLLQFGVGVRVEDRVKIKKIDKDYFGTDE